MGHILEAEKGNFSIRGRGRPTVYGSCACGIQSITAQEVSLGSPRVGTIHAQTPTPHAPPLQAFLADFSQQTTRFSHLLANRGTPTIDDYYAKYSRSTAERLYDHDNATRRTFDEAARHAEALFAAHDMSPARD